MRNTAPTRPSGPARWRHDGRRGGLAPLYRRRPCSPQLTAARIRFLRHKGEALRHGRERHLVLLLRRRDSLVILAVAVVVGVAPCRAGLLAPGPIPRRRDAIHVALAATGRWSRRSSSSATAPRLRHRPLKHGRDVHGLVHVLGQQLSCTELIQSNMFLLYRACSCALCRFAPSDLHRFASICSPSPATICYLILGLLVYAASFVSMAAGRRSRASVLLPSTSHHLFDTISKTEVNIPA